MQEEIKKTSGAPCDEYRDYGAYYRKIKEHPCYDPKAAHIYGRMHLPVAPKCNVQCNFCVREFDCVNESRPGITSQVLKPTEAISKVKEVVEKHPNITVIGIAGPGDPLFNDETFITLALIQKVFPDLIFCLSTNGLLLPDRIDRLKDLNLSNLTVTMNTVNPEIGAKIYSFVYYGGEILKGEEGAKLLLKNQLSGIERAVKAGIIVKVNTVMIPTVNDNDIINVSKKAKDLGVYMLNVMPLIPQYKFSHISPPSKKELAALRKECEMNIRQMRHCRQCRADAIGKLSEDLSSNFYQSMKKISPSELSIQREEFQPSKKIRFSVATTGKSGTVDLHFGHTEEYSIYEVEEESGEIKFREIRRIKSKFCQGPECVTEEGQEELLINIMNLLRDCHFLLCRRIGNVPRKWLTETGITVIEDFDRIENAINRVMSKKSNVFENQMREE